MFYVSWMLVTIEDKILSGILVDFADHFLLFN